MKATKNPMTIMIEVKPEEVTDAVRGFAWYKMLANKPDFIPDPKEYVFGTCTFDEASGNFLVAFSKLQPPAPKENNG